MRAMDNERKESEVSAEGRARQQGRPSTSSEYCHRYTVRRPSAVRPTGAAAAGEN